MLFVSDVPANGQKTLYFVGLITSWTGWATHHQILNKLNKTFLTMAWLIKLNLASIWLTGFKEHFFFLYIWQCLHMPQPQTRTQYTWKKFHYSAWEGTIIWNKNIHIPVLQSVCIINIIILGNDVRCIYLVASI